MGMYPVGTGAKAACPRQRADIVLAIAAGADVLKPVRVFILRVYRKVMEVFHATVVVNASLIPTGRRIAMMTPASERALDRCIQDGAQTRSRSLSCLVGVM